MFPLSCAQAHKSWDERTQENMERTQKHGYAVMHT